MCCERVRLEDNWLIMPVFSSRYSRVGVLVLAEQDLRGHVPGYLAAAGPAKHSCLLLLYSGIPNT